ncbi:MAG: type II toxin-antitoxin system RelE/ParE family toxin [Pirellulaceae bacterium]|nr:type II toxin-antitoxin system RelE/ParE family toxin [Pirellulaceae bacterium]
MFRLTILPSAEVDIEWTFAWWGENRSMEQATRWYSEIFKAIQSLRDFPERCPIAPESDIYPSGVRALFFGIGPHPSHRILFTIVDSDVFILRIRHLAQNYLPGST